MSSRAQVARSMVWTILESFGASGLSVIGLIVVARYISPAEMGVAAMSLSIIQLLYIPAEFLFLDALIQKPDVEELDYDTAHTASTIIGVVTSLLCWLLSTPLANWLSIPEIAPVFAVMGISVAAMGFGTAIVARQRREMEFKTLALRTFAGRLFGVSGGIFLALKGAGVWALVAQQVLMVFFSSLVLWLKCRVRPSFRFSTSHCRPLALFGLRSIAVGAAIMSVPRVFTLFIGLYFSTAAAGFLNLAFRVVDILRDIVSNAVTQIALPMFSRYTQDIAQLQRIFALAVGFTCAVTFPMFAGLGLCADEVIQLVFGSKWLASSHYIMLLSSLTLLYFLRMYSVPLATARGYPHLPIYTDLTALAVVVVGMVLYGHKSIMAASIVWAVRLAFSLPVDLHNQGYILAMRPKEQLKPGIVPLVATLAMAVAVLGLAYILPDNVGSVLPMLLAKASIGAVVYVITYVALDRKRIKELLQFVRSALHRSQA